MKVSIVIATYNRAHLLERALRCYATQSFPKEHFELVYVDDWSTDWTDGLLREYAEQMNIVVCRPTYKPRGFWRSEASVINLGLRAARGEFIIGTHPEVLPGRDSIRRMVERSDNCNCGHMYYACKVYMLTQHCQSYLDSVDWLLDRTQVRNLPTFYELGPSITGAVNEYHPREIDKTTEFGSWVFGGMKRETWKMMGGFQEYHQWGSVDVDFLTRRRILDIPNITLMEEDTICVHQNHDLPDPTNPDYVPTVRDTNAALNSMRHYQSEQDAKLNYL